MGTEWDKSKTGLQKHFLSYVPLCVQLLPALAAYGRSGREIEATLFEKILNTKK